MYKLKYYSLSKEQKLDLKKKFYETKHGQEIQKRLNRLFIIGILGIIFSIYLILVNQNIWELISAITLLIISIFFIYQSYHVRIKKINNYLTKTK